MSLLITIIAFIFILGITVAIHEFGHFLFAKKAGIYVYEFSIGMGPKLFKWKRKNDETEYYIRLLPIGGYVSMAGEEVEDDKNVPDDRKLQSKPWKDRFLTMVAGVTFNFLLAIVVLFIIGAINGVTFNATRISETKIKDVKVGDKIVKINNHKVNNYDKLSLELAVVNTKPFNMTVKHKNGKEQTVKVKPTNIKKDKKGNVKSYEIGFKVDGDYEHNFFTPFKYAISKFFSTIEQMFFTVWYLITGTLSLKMLSGPVGIFAVVGDAAKTGIMSLLSLLALISINVGFINLLPIPAFDGGHILFLIIEKIIGRKVNPKVENIIHTIFFVLLMILMVYITFNDILKLI